LRKVRLFVNHGVGMPALNFIVLSLRDGDVFLAFANGFGAHEVLEARRGKNERQADGVFSDVCHRDPRARRDEHGSAAVHFSYGVSQPDPCGPGLQEEDFVWTRMLVGGDCLSGREVFRAKDEMRRTSVLWVNF